MRSHSATVTNNEHPGYVSRGDIYPKRIEIVANHTTCEGTISVCENEKKLKSFPYTVGDSASFKQAHNDAENWARTGCQALQFVANTAQRLLQQTGGFSLDAKGRRPCCGYLVGTNGTNVRKVRKTINSALTSDLVDFFTANPLPDSHYYWGGHYNDPTQLDLTVVQGVTDLEDAKTLARVNGYNFVFDCSSDQFVAI